MKPSLKWGVIAALTAGLTITAFAGGHPDCHRPTPEQRQEFLEKRLSKLTAEEQKLARALEPLRDSLMRSIGDYHHKVTEGAAARSLTSERANITLLQTQIQRLQADHPEVWLDLLADLPGPGGPHRRPGGPECRPMPPDCPMRHQAPPPSAP